MRDGIFTWGLTSSDVLDTALALQLVASLDVLTAQLESLIPVHSLSGTAASQHNYDWSIARHSCGTDHVWL